MYILSTINIYYRYMYYKINYIGLQANIIIES